ncbi:SusD/RagB-like outer membrane lipoprotein [Flavobacterium cutihirudinis]|uniref:SusD/RagB-like outer membrane lipoprotein n=1 Tax=Flavobacterium cutihirudinis TaxID=1265740 RepID=A0A3D9FTV9_9FLAO|nr:RagB/SusD family nutrient uptake outer membrane protein [Flavobacterium cutihirudinis]RED23369.1 SusD/RagB-like outer membrane lipoprotein [Flavobacterium cutihirudinis]
MIINKLKTSAICISLLAAVSCTSDFENINTNETGASNKDLEQDYNNIKAPFGPMFANVLILTAWPYQYQQNLQADVWSGYMSSGAGFATGNNHTYSLNDGWNYLAWEEAYKGIMANALRIKQRAQGKYDQFYSISLIIKVAEMSRITDIYGPILYSKYGTEGTSWTYDSQQDVYNQMFEELDFAVTDLTKRVAAKEATLFASTDVSTYAGSYEKWARYANSLRLRLAMHIVKVDPALAKTQAEKSLNSTIGVMKTADDAMILNPPNYSNPVAAISQSWTDINMSADIESIMGGYNDPRLASYFISGPAYPGQFKGIRNGIDITDAHYRDFSKVNSSQTVWMTTAEVYFLRAEGALRGWNVGGTAKDLYEAGIAASFAQYGLSGAAAYAQTTSVAKDYDDPTSTINDAVAVNLVPVKYNEAGTNEQQLQQIITQKWICGFPEGQEAWTEWRRTGYPKLFKIVKNTSGGVIPTDLGVRRINFINSEKAGNKVGYESGVALLNGPDNGATRLWWDVNKGNF